MACLTDLAELVGFFSYSREDDADSHGALSALRTRIQGGLRGQLGRTAKTFRLWQDKEAIPSGTLWESEIKNAVAQSVFFIPIITPTVVASLYCRFELESFLAREAELGRDDLVFPILYIDVPALEDATRRQNDPVLSLIAKRQYVDWREFQYLEIDSTEVKRQVGRFCTHIRDALHRPWISPEQRKLQEEAAARERADEERRRADDDAYRLAEARRQRAEQEAREQADQAAREREAEMARERIRQERLRAETAEKRRAEEEGRRRLVAEEQRSSLEEARLRLEAQQAFENAKSDSSAVAIAKFIADYPQSDYAAEARKLHAERLVREYADRERRQREARAEQHTRETVARRRIWLIVLFLVVGVGVLLFDLFMPGADFIWERPFLIGLPLFALGFANILSGLGLVRTLRSIPYFAALTCLANFFLCGLLVYLVASDISRNVGAPVETPIMIFAALAGIACAFVGFPLAGQGGVGTKWTLLETAAAVLVLGGIFGLWLLGSFFALFFNYSVPLADESWLLGKAPLDAAMVFIGTAVFVGSRRLVPEPLIAAVCGVGVVLYAGDLWSFWNSSDASPIYRLLDVIGMLVNLGAGVLLVYGYLQRRSISSQE